MKLEVPIYPLTILTTIDGTSRKFIISGVDEDYSTSEYIYSVDFTNAFDGKHVLMRILKNLSLDKLMIMNQFVFMDIVKNSREESKMLNVLLINFLKMLKSLMILVNVLKSILNVMLDLSYLKREHMFVFLMLSKFLKCVNPRKN